MIATKEEEPMDEEEKTIKFSINECHARIRVNGITYICEETKPNHSGHFQHAGTWAHPYTITWDDPQTLMLGSIVEETYTLLKDISSIKSSTQAAENLKERVLNILPYYSQKHHELTDP